MKLLKTIAVISLSTLLASHSLEAKTNSTQSAKNNQSQSKEDISLKRFNQAAQIRYLGRTLLQSQQGQPVLQFQFDLENKSQKLGIKEINWIAAFAYNNQVIFAQQMPINFGQNVLKAQSKMTVNLNVELARLPENVQKIMLDKNAQIQSIYGAKSITFSNNSKIIVK